MESLSSMRVCGGGQNATEELARLEQCFDHVKKQLFDRMHNTVRPTDSENSCQDT